MTALEALTAAKKLIATEDKWCKNFDAMFEGRSCGATSRFAQRYCASGALIAVTGEPQTLKRYDRAHVYKCSQTLLFGIRAAIDFALPDGFTDLQRYNDHEDTTHDNILEMFDRAIAYMVDRGSRK